MRGRLNAILADCQDLVAQHRLNAEEARDIVAKGMLADQPLPLAPLNRRVAEQHPASPMGNEVRR
jgi:hypothetical protein